MVHEYAGILSRRRTVSILNKFNLLCYVWMFVSSIFDGLVMDNMCDVTYQVVSGLYIPVPDDVSAGLIRKRQKDNRR